MYVLRYDIAEKDPFCTIGMVTFGWRSANEVPVIGTWKGYVLAQSHSVKCCVYFSNLDKY